MSLAFVRRWCDIPPVWLLAAMAVVWMQARFLPLGSGFQRWIGVEVTWLLWAVAGALTLAAVIQMRAYQTTVHPHDNSTHLVTGGVFGLTRNPIYLSDVLILLGVVFWLGTWASLVIVALFIWVLQHRFIRGEELRLKALFPEEWDAYAQKTRRWI